VRPDSNDIRIPVGAVPGTVPTGDLGDLGDLGEATPCRSSYIMGTWSAPVPCCARRPTTDGLNVMPSMRPRPADVTCDRVARGIVPLNGPIVCHCAEDTDGP